MSLRLETFCPIPEQTQQVARAAFPNGSLCLRIADELGGIFRDEQFAKLFPRRGQPAEAPARLALILLLQYAENLSDRRAANAVRGRIDWKYALGLELTDPGFDSTVLSEFRARLVQGSAEQILFETLLERCRERKLLTGHHRQRTDSTHVLGVIRAVNRLECVGETMRHALNVLATAAPIWLLEHSQVEWIDRYGSRVEDYRLPKSATERQAHAQQIGVDGFALLDGIIAEAASSWLRQLPAIEVLRRIWVQQYYRSETEVRWRSDAEGLPPAARFISSPYDPEARYAKKRSTSWVGYKVHLTETCAEGPHLITHVETTPAPIADGDVTETIHVALQQKDLLPSVHLVDAGYVDAPSLAAGQRDYGVDLVGPTRADYHWQAKEAKGFAASCFELNWEKQQATCPEGCTSVSWTPAEDRSHRDVIKIKFASADCGACPSQGQCTHSARPRRTLTIRPQEQHMALQMARRREASQQFAEVYAARAGIEGTISQGVRAFGLRRVRYVGQAKTHLQHVLTAAAINLVRIAAWLAEELPSKTRTSRFVALLQPSSD